MGYPPFYYLSPAFRIQEGHLVKLSNFYGLKTCSP